MPAATPIARLQRALLAVTNGDARQLVEIARGCGLGGIEARRAANGITINSGAYLKLCRAVDIDPVTGRRSQKGPPITDLDWNRVAVKVLMTLIEGKTKPGKPKSSLRKLAKVCGLPFVTVNRAKHSQPISPDSFIKLCKGLGCHPHQFLKPSPPTFHVKQPLAQFGTEKVTA